jgi:hypothetical protein
VVIIAGDFATTPSGYVITVLVTVTFGVIGAMWIDLRGWRSRTDKALTEQTRALAVIVTRADHIDKAAGEATSATRALEMQTALLKQRLDQLESDKRADHARYDAEIAQRRRQARPAGT